jgi:hypothetical protein
MELLKGPLKRASGGEMFVCERRPAAMRGTFIMG